MGRKVLLVSGLSDYGVVSFEYYNKKNNMTLQDWVKRLESKESKTEYIDTNDYDFSVELYTFGEIDKKFVEFIRDEIVDYDMSKHTDFFVVEE